LGSFVSVSSVTISSPKVGDKIVTSKLRDSTINSNSISVLHNWLQGTGQESPKYTVKGPKNNLFQARVKCQDQYFIGKPATTKRQAERNAAAEALEWLHKTGQIPK
jgi:ATP-dependent RNA helicase DHX36